MNLRGYDEEAVVSEIRKYPHALALAPCPIEVSRIRLKGGGVSVFYLNLLK